MIKGDDPSRIVLGNSLTGEDGYPGQPFDYMLANPPFGVDWKKYADPIIAERDGLGDEGRYGPGLPRVSDGSLLFLLHMLSKMKPVTYGPNGTMSGGTRLAIVFSGSPLFAGAAGGGESEIRRWIIENDYLEGIVALPDQLFYNTGISTYFWILSNRKNPQRRNKIVLLDARESFTKMRKSLGDKRKYVRPEQTVDITKLYDHATDPDQQDKRVKVFARETFGYQRITVERPLRRRWELTEDAIGGLVHEKVWAAWLTPPRGTKDPVGYVHQIEQVQPALLEALSALVGHREATETAFKKRLTGAVPGFAQIPANVVKAIISVASIPDPEAPIITDRKGNPLPDPDLRDAENISFPEGYLGTGAREESALVAQAEDYLHAEIRPYAADAWIDHTKTKIGYEVPFTRHFYEYIPPRPVTQIDAELTEIEAQIQELLAGLKK